jgi:hypothetical protein
MQCGMFNGKRNITGYLADVRKIDNYYWTLHKTALYTPALLR